MTRQFLFNELKPKAKAHYWIGSDTQCHLWATGGIKQTRPGWVVTDDRRNRDMCHMCLEMSGTHVEQEPQMTQ